MSSNPDPGEIRVVSATPDDAELIRHITQAAFAEYIGVLRPESGAHTESEEDVRRALARGGGVLAWIGNAAVGAARYQPQDGVLYIGRVAVLPAFRGRGVASAMMRHLEGVARAHNLPALQVGVRMSLPSNLALYRRLGYELMDVQPHPRGPDRVGTLVKRLAR